MTHILTINAGSSSLKCAVFACVDGSQTRVATRHAEAIGTGGPASHDEALAGFIDGLAGEVSGLDVAAVGHRVVHGGPDFSAPILVGDAELAALSALVPLAPLHQPNNIAGIVAARRAFPAARQVACFDTGFHRRAGADDAYAIPRRFYEDGVRRYGFHGLSYAYVSGRLAQIEPDLARKRVVIAHLGNGASACVLRDGVPLQTTMGFSPLDGLIMGTRPGRIDPGVLLWMVQEKGMSGEVISELLYKRSGLLALSGISSDMRTLEGSPDPSARRAIEAFVARLCSEIAGLAAEVQGLDALVFTGGIGENSALVRGLVMARLAWLGIAADEAANRSGSARLSATGSAIRVLRIPTDEEAMIAHLTLEALASLLSGDRATGDTSRHPN